MFSWPIFLLFPMMQSLISFCKEISYSQQKKARNSKKYVPFILMPEYLIPIYQKQEVALFICIKKGDRKLLHSVIVVKS